MAVASCISPRFSEKSRGGNSPPPWPCTPPASNSNKTPRTTVLCMIETGPSRREREGGRKGGREGEREGGREGERERGRERGREGGRERGRKQINDSLTNTAPG